MAGAPDRASELVSAAFGWWVWGPRAESSESLQGRKLLHPSAAGGLEGGPRPRGQVCTICFPTPPTTI